MVSLNYFTIDAFTSQPFGGNPAAVVLLSESLPDDILQKIATEMNLAETAYLSPLQVGCNPWKSCSKFKLRWFTPVFEINLCGHATLAAAHALIKEFGNESPIFQFETLSGTLEAFREGDGIRLSFPVLPGKNPTPEEAKIINELVRAVSEGVFQVADVLFDHHTRYVIISTAQPMPKKAFESINPNADALLKHDGSLVDGIVITTQGGATEGLENYHFASRSFFPWTGLLEDPVTGSSHSVLAPYWGEKLNLREMKAIQCSKRGGEMFLRLKDDGKMDIIGNAVSVISGTIHC